MQAVSLKHNVVKMREDMSALTQWAQQFAEWGNRQGGMDIKYVSERYANGLSKVADHCKFKMKLVESERFEGAAAEILQHCNGMGGGSQQTFGYQ